MVWANSLHKALNVRLVFRIFNLSFFISLIFAFFLLNTRRPKLHEFCPRVVILMHWVGGVDSTCFMFGAQRHGGGEEVKNEFYKKLHKFCNICDIVILLIVAC